MDYMIKRLSIYDLRAKEIMDFFVRAGKDVASQYDNKFDWRNFRLKRYVERGFVWVCFRNGLPVGFSLAQLYPSILDPKIAILFQDLLYAQPGTRAASLLLKHFIDFGTRNANHIITAIGTQTNIKGKSLEKLGFKKFEELYRIEVSK